MKTHTDSNIEVLPVLRGRRMVPNRHPDDPVPQPDWFLGT